MEPCDKKDCIWFDTSKNIICGDNYDIEVSKCLSCSHFKKRDNYKPLKNKEKK